MPQKRNEVNPGVQSSSKEKLGNILSLLSVTECKFQVTFHLGTISFQTEETSTIVLLPKCLLRSKIS